MKVFVVGLSRTGTSSLTDALNTLGVPTVHFPCDEQTIQELTHAEYKLSILEQYDGLSDTPVVPYFAQFDAIYPHSKFILTTRDKSDWISAVQMHFELQESWWDPASDFRKYVDFIHAVVYGAIVFNRERFSYVYDTHCANVRSYFRNRSEDFLEMNIFTGEGWEKLAPFLGRPIPEQPFPHKNTWVRDVRHVASRVSTVVPWDAPLLLIDAGALDNAIRGSRQVLSLGSDYFDDGDEELVKSFEARYREGIRFVVITWTAFEWLDSRPLLASMLRQHGTLLHADAQVRILSLGDES